MSVNYVTRPDEYRLFRQCRRAWDFGARERGDYERAEPLRVFDFALAIHDALDAYYFPGMWDWGRAIVRPIALAGFEKSMRRQRDQYGDRRRSRTAGDIRPPSRTAGDIRPLTDDQVADWDRHMELGAATLAAYFDWAAEIDRFTPIQVAALFDISVPDPADASSGLLVPDGRGILLRVRIDLAVIDDHELYWLVEHRISVGGDWPELDYLRLDEQALIRSWAWQLHFLADIEGTIYNELRIGTSQPAPAGRPAVRAFPGAAGVVTQRDNGMFRRTQMPRAAIELERHGIAVAHQTQDMTDRALRIYPNPSPAHCSPCAFRAPCLAINQGGDAGPMLDESYRRRDGEDFELGRLGSVMGFVPEIHRVRQHQAPGRQA